MILILISGIVIENAHLWDKIQKLLIFHLDIIIQIG